MRGATVKIADFYSLVSFPFPGKPRTPNRNGMGIEMGTGMENQIRLPMTRVNGPGFSSSKFSTDGKSDFFMGLLVEPN